MITIRPYAVADAAACADMLTLAGREAFGANAWLVHDVAFSSGKTITFASHRNGGATGERQRFFQLMIVKRMCICPRMKFLVKQRFRPLCAVLDRE
jgi:hypothetical protein